MTISNHKLMRLAGLSALLAGVCYVLVGVFHPPNVPASVTTDRWAIVHVIACAMAFFALIGLTGLYLRQAARTGLLGFVGYLLLNLWFVLIMGFSFVEAFVLPHVAHTAPAFVDAWMKMFNGPASDYDLGALPTAWLLAAPLYILGGITFGIATFRAAILPRWAGALLAVGTLLAPLAAAVPNGTQPKIAIPVGIALAWLGYGLWIDRQEETP